MGDTDPTANFCGECGEPVHGARFCSNCGAATVAQQAVAPQVVVAASAGDTEEMAPPRTNGDATPALPDAVAPPPRPARPYRDEPPPPPPPASAAPRRGPRGAIIAAAVGLVLIAGGVAAYLIASGGSSSSGEDAAYRRDVARAFGPVLGANRQLSDTLASLRGLNRANAQIAVRRARQATTAATGALGALDAPSGSQKLASDAQQVLDREAAYLGAVGAVLGRPSVAGASQLQTLASNLTSALHAAGPTVAGTSETVSGAGHLASWAGQAAATLKHRAQAKAKARAKRQASTTAPASGGTTTAPAPAVNPYANGRACGDGVFAGPNTSCPFAFNVRTAYYSAPGTTATVQVYSPTTGQTYTMNCAPSGSAVTCSGGNNASVTF
jgi:hypothetical protein